MPRARCGVNRGAASHSHPISPLPALLSRGARPFLACFVLAAAPAAVGAQATGARSVSPVADTARVAVTRPMVIAYLVVPEGAVDTMPDLAVTADDWNYAVAILGDSLKARGIAYDLVTQPQLRITSRGAATVTVPLGGVSATGFVLARPGAPPCVRRGAAEMASILAAADSFFARAAWSRAGSRAPCGETGR